MLRSGLRVTARSSGGACAAEALAYLDAGTARRLRLRGTDERADALGRRRPVLVGRGSASLRRGRTARVAVRLTARAARALRRRRTVTLTVRTTSVIDQAGVESPASVRKVTLRR